MVVELPAVLSLRIFRPPHVLGVAVMLFGVFATCLSAAKSYGAVLAIRLLIGLSEAWVQTGWVYLSLWYKRDEIATRSGELTYRPPPLSKMLISDDSLLLYLRPYWWSRKWSHCLRCR
jgi:hypothetical protein